MFQTNSLASMLDLHYYSSAEPEIFHEELKAYLTSFDQPHDQIMLKACVHRVLDDYTVYLKNLNFASFVRLTEAARRTN